MYTRAKAFLERHANDPKRSRKGGGFAIRLAEIYLASDTICRFTLGRDLDAVKCSELGPDLWKAFQKKKVETAGHDFDRTTRRRLNNAINSRLRAARSLFLPALLREYRASGIHLPDDTGAVVPLPDIYVKPAKVNDEALLKAWRGLKDEDPALWLTIGLARFAGLRQKEIRGCAAGWIKDGCIEMHDREEEGKLTKTGEVYKPQVIEPELRDYLTEFAATHPPQTPVIQATPKSRAEWFSREPQKWLRSIGLEIRAPLHRLRGLYAEEVARLMKDAIEARQEALRVASKALGHTTTATTVRHYISPDAV